MTDQEVVQTVRSHIEGKFPRACNCCGRQFATLKEFLQQTRHIGNPISYDLELDESKPSEPIGTMALANCLCGSTLAISSDGMSIPTMWKLMRFARQETERRGINFGEFLAEIREKIDRDVMR